MGKGMGMGWWWIVLLASALVVRIVRKVWWSPMRCKKMLSKQGISGPPYRLLSGNLMEIIHLLKEANSAPPMEMEMQMRMDTESFFTHDIISRVLPEIHRWSSVYGKNFVYWFGPTARVVVPQPELIREVMSNKTGVFEKPDPPPQLRQLTGDGLPNSTGDKWARQRRIVGMAFHAEALKSMVPTVVASTATLLDKWDLSHGEVEVLEDLRELTADIIARTAFGSSYERGKHIFDLQTEQALLAAESFKKFSIPCYRFLPTPTNIRGRKVNREIHRALSSMIEKRKQDLKLGGAETKDLLGVMMKHAGISFQDMIDECKTFFVAGHETTSLLLTWALILLAMHPHWQHLLREEVTQVCGRRPPAPDVLNRLRNVNMVVQETLRLYPPLPYMVRRSMADAKVGEWSIPKHTEVMVPIAAVHHDRDIWGSDASHFNPQRFGEGVSKACNGNAFMPFGVGPRICAGMNFSLIQAKVVLCMVVQRFSFTLSPNYVHAPCQNFTIRPRQGAPLLFTSLLDAPSPSS